MKTAANLDAMLTPDQAAEWLQIPVRELMSKARAGTIPAFRLGHKTVRFHPRTILAFLAKKDGIPYELIAASFGVKSRESETENG